MARVGTSASALISGLLLVRVWTCYPGRAEELPSGDAENAADVDGTGALAVPDGSVDGLAFDSEQPGNFVDGEDGR
jgi:hypothetical protein